MHEDVDVLEFTGNKRHITVGNFATNDWVSLFLMSAEAAQVWAV